MGHVLIWWVMVQILGIVALPITLILFKNLPDRGYALSKALGILLLSYILWLAATAHLLPNTRLSILLVLVFLAAFSLFLLSRRRRELLSFLSQNRYLILITEALFLLLFLLWALIRAYDPQIAATEKPMDFAFLNGILRSEHFPPNDPWLSGNSISYYYFGYMMMAFLTRLSGIPSSVSYNLALALLFALTGIGAFSLVYNLVRGTSLGEAGNAKMRIAIGYGLVGLAFVILLGNLEGILEVLRAQGLSSGGFWQWVGIKGLETPFQSPTWYPSEHWWWWRATRVIDTVVGGRSLDYTITEFPYFSFLLGDLHPHVMSLPFVLLSLALGLNVLRSPEPVGLPWIRRNWALFGLAILCLGALAFLNSWDFPTFTLIFLAALFLQRYLRQRGISPRLLIETALISLAVFGGAILLYIPFYWGLRSQVRIPDTWQGVSTQPLHYFILWGLFLFLTLSFLLGHLWPVLRGRLLPRSEIYAAILPPLLPLALWSLVELVLSAGEGDVLGGFISVGQRAWHLLPLLAILSLALFAIIRGAKHMGERRGEILFVFLLIFFGFLLTLGAELFYLKDVFGNRMNTVFKFYYQAWVLLAIGSSFGLYYIGFRWRASTLSAGSMQFLWGSLLTLFLLGSSIYPIAAVYTKTGAFGGELTLDGLAFLERSYPAEYEAIQWLWEKVEGSPVIVEASDGDWTDFGRISSRTGLPTLLGWPDHELQWRGSDEPFKGRREDIDRIYQSRDVDEVMALLEKYDVSYVYFGRLERSRYTSEPVERLGDFLEVAFQNQGVTIFKVGD